MNSKERKLRLEFMCDAESTAPLAELEACPSDPLPGIGDRVDVKFMILEINRRDFYYQPDGSIMAVQFWCKQIEPKKEKPKHVMTGSPIARRGLDNL